MSQPFISPERKE
jgi:hypothetical protein